MDVKLINPFLYGAKEVLQKMASVEATVGTPYIKQNDRATGDVSGIIGLTGDAIGSLAISFSESCICGIAGAMLSESFVQANQEVFDAVGEITNMISGVARTYLEKDTLTVWAGIPAVVIGKDHYVKHILKSPSIVIPFTTEYGSFFVDVCIKSTLSKKSNVAAEQPAAKPNSVILDGTLPPMDVITPPKTVTATDDSGRTDRMVEKRAGGNEESQSFAGKTASGEAVHEYSDTAEIQEGHSGV